MCGEVGNTSNRKARRDCVPPVAYSTQGEVAKEYDSKEGFVIRSPSETDIRWEAGTNIQAYPSKAVCLNSSIVSGWGFEPGPPTREDSAVRIHKAFLAEARG